MTYRDFVLDGIGQPEIWQEFENTLDGTGYGTSGDDPWGTEAGAVTFGDPGSGIPGEGPTGRSGIFNGSTRIVSGLGKFAFSTTSAFAIWVKTTDTNGTFMQFGSGTSTASNYWRMRLTAGKVVVLRHPVTTIMTSTRTIDDGQWHMVVFKKDSATSGKLFIDGTLEATYNTSWSPNISGFLYLGMDRVTASSANNNFIGELDQACHWPGGLTDTQIADHWTKGINPLTDDIAVNIEVATFAGMADYTVAFTEATLPVKIKLDVEFARGVIKNRLTSNLYDAKIRRSNENQTLVSVSSVDMKKPRPVVTLNMKEN